MKNVKNDTISENGREEKNKDVEVRDSVCRDKGPGDSERIDQVEMKYI